MEAADICPEAMRAGLAADTSPEGVMATVARGASPRADPAFTDLPAFTLAAAIAATLEGRGQPAVSPGNMSAHGHPAPTRPKSQQQLAAPVATGSPPCARAGVTGPA